MRQDPTADLGRRRLFRTAAAGAGLAVAGGVLHATPAAAQGTGYVPYAVPYRTYDSRNDPDGKISGGETYTIAIDGPPAGASAAMVNLTVVNTVDAGYLVAYGQGRQRPEVSTINWWGPNQILANMGAIVLGETDNDINVYCGGTGATDFLVDLYGYFE